MKKLIVLLFMALSISAYSQTTLEEWNYITKGYKIQKESGLDMKKGYDVKFLITENSFINSIDRTFNLYELIRLKDNSSAGIIIEYIKRDRGVKSIFYFGIPQKNSSVEIWNMAHNSNFAFENKEIGIAYSWALTRLISFKYL
mgnify:CR=1 FL=1